MAETKPHANDMERMTEIHARMHGLLTRVIPMNFRDEENLNDLLIPGQDEAYQCGLERGRKDAKDLLEALRAIVGRYEFDGIPNDSLPLVEVARAAIAQATGSQS